MKTVSRSLFALSSLAVLLAVGPAGCKNGGRRGKSELARWVDDPTSGTRDGEVITIPDLGVKFEIPDTLYVFRQCGEAPHNAQGSEKWVPVISCASTNEGAFGGGEAAEDSFAADESADASSDAEPIDMTIYATHKTRPLDERAVAWFENQYKQAGLAVEEISYQPDFQKKSGIYAKLHVVDESGTPTREIVQFLFPHRDIVFVARMEYPFGESRAVEQDWGYILWNYELVETTEGK